MYNMGYYRPMGFTPAAAVAALPKVLPTVTKVFSTAMKLFTGVSIGGRGDFQKFDREIKPTLQAKANSTGRPCAAFWFGDVVMVDGAGNRSVIGHYSTIDEGVRILQSWVNSNGRAYAYMDGTWRLFQPGMTTGTYEGEAGTGGGLNLGTVALIGGGLLLAKKLLF